jgi:hypothetical protein
MIGLSAASLTSRSYLSICTAVVGQLITRGDQKPDRPDASPDVEGGKASAGGGLLRRYAGVVRM